jgi:hypothetical protein
MSRAPVEEVKLGKLETAKWPSEGSVDAGSGGLGAITLPAESSTERAKGTPRIVGRFQSKGLAHGPGKREQIKGAHPATLEHDWSPPAPAKADMVKLKEVLRIAGQLVWAGLRACTRST